MPASKSEWGNAYAACMQQYRQKRNAECRAIIIHPLFPNGGRHFWDEHHKKTREVSIKNISMPFLIMQDFSGSKENLGAVLWNGSIILANYLSSNYRSIFRKILQAKQKHNQTVNELKVCELGCGIAPLAAMVTASLGAITTATDLPDVVKMAENNVEINRIRHSIPQNRLKLQPLVWGANSGFNETDERPREGCSFASNIDDASQGEYDLILAADVLYATAQVNDLDVKLLSTLKKLMRPQSHTTMLLSYTVRSGKEALFFTQRLGRNGFRYRELDSGVDVDAVVACSIWRGLQGAETEEWLGAGANPKIEIVADSEDPTGRTHIMEIKRI